MRANSLKPDRPLAIEILQNQEVVGRVLTRHACLEPVEVIGLKPDLRLNPDNPLACRSSIYRAIDVNNRSINRAPTQHKRSNGQSGINITTWQHGSNAASVHREAQ